jgi:hypothetical protein
MRPEPISAGLREKEVVTGGPAACRGSSVVRQTTPSGRWPF